MTICPMCGYTSDQDQDSCPECGNQLRRPVPGKGIRDIRQGISLKDGPESPIYTVPQGSAYTYQTGTDLPPKNRRRKTGIRKTAEETAVPKNGRRVRRVMINWAKVFLALMILMVLFMAGGYLYLKTTDSGQLILARLGRSANADALWTLGTEYLDQGYIDKALACYEAAYAQEPEREDLYSKLLLLGEAYEAANRPDRAEALYIRLHDELDSKNTTAWRLHAGILSSQGRTMELASLLKTAYDKTGDTIFLRQRNDMIPTSPTVSLAAGKYMLDQKTMELVKRVSLISEEEYDIFYLLDAEETATLPEDGVLYTVPLELKEGYHTIRAVALSADLMSDEMTATYTVVAPTPVSPKLSLAPDDYETRQRVWIRYNGDDADSVTIYYTIDGQSPDPKKSPIYTGEPFWLPGGRVHVKAIAENAYGKISNEMDVELKINIDFKRYFNENDRFSSFTIMSTTREQFTRTMGQPQQENNLTSGPSSSCVELKYAWGYARFMPSTSGYVLYEYYTEYAETVGPRNTKIGMSSSAITEKYRDMGQANDQNGDRSIYWDSSEGFAKLYKLDETHARIDYVDKREDGGAVVLSYYLTNDAVTAMGMRYDKTITW